MPDTVIRKVVLCGHFDEKVGWLAKAWARGLEENGIEVHRCELSSPSSGILWYARDHYVPWALIRNDNRRFIECVATVRPDVALVYQGLEIVRHTIETARHFTWVAGYTNDDPFGRTGRHWRWRHFQRSLNSYSSHHVYRDKSVGDYVARGVRNVAVLRSYYIPWQHRPPALTEQDRQATGHPVVFIGHAEDDDRIEYVRALLRAGLPLRIFHPYVRGWKKLLTPSELRKVGAERGLFGEEYVKTIAASKISLCFFSRRNCDEYTRRVFEVPACGGFLLAERTPTMQRLYREGVEAEFFGSPDELIHKVRYYLEHEPERDLIARRGRERCVGDGHDVVSRMKQWLEDTSRFMSPLSEGTAMGHACEGQ